LVVDGWARACRPGFSEVVRTLHAVLKQLLREGATDTAGRAVQLERPRYVGTMP
jgi:hypothetical protein